MKSIYFSARNVSSYIEKQHTKKSSLWCLWKQTTVGVCKLTRVYAEECCTRRRCENYNFQLQF
jgi:hypothetical protein